MGTHPNAMLQCVFTPDDLARKTYRAVLTEYADNFNDIKVGGETYHTMIMESDYNEDDQIAAPEGTIVLWNLVTYGYGRSIKWDDLVKAKEALEAFAKEVGAKHHCSYEIRVSANYW
jgi:hypothetical protein